MAQTSLDSSTGSTTLTLPSDNLPSLALVSNSDGVVVLMGFVNKASGSSTISTKDTAVALLFYGLGGYRLPPLDQQPLLDAIAAQPATQGLADVLAQAMATQPTALSDGTSAVDAALASAIQTLAALPYTGPAFTQRQTARDRIVGGTVGQVLLQPAVAQSGTQLDISSNAAGSFLITNNFRRKTQTYLYETANVGADSTTTDVIPGQFIGTTNVDGTQNIGSLFGLIQQAIFTLTGTSTQTAFVPKVSPPVPLTLDGTATRTKYAAVVVGPTFKWTDDSYSGPLPTAWTSPSLSSARAGWLDASKTLTYNTFFFDVLFPMLEVAAGAQTLNSTDPTDLLTLTTTIAGEFQNAYNLDYAANFPGSTVAPVSFLTLLLQGSWKTAGPAGLKLLKQPRIYSVVSDAIKQRFGRELGSTGSAFMRRFTSINQLINGINIGLGIGDISAVLADIGNSNAADSWDLTAVASNVTLTPVNTTVDANSQVFLTAHAPSVEGQGLTLIYHWNVAGAVGGTLSDGHNHVGATDFDSNYGSVTYTSPPGVVVVGTDVVTATVSVLTPTGDSGVLVQHQVGSAQATVNEQGSNSVVLSPHVRTITPSQTIPFTVLAPSVQIPSLQLSYTYNLSGAAGGTISDGLGQSSTSGFTSPSGNVTYTPDPNAVGNSTEALSVNVTVLNGSHANQTVGTDTATITVDASLGANWTQHTASTPASIYEGVAFGNGRYVAVGAGTDSVSGNGIGTVVTSVDGKTWTPATTDFSSTTLIQNVRFINGKFIAMALTSASYSNGVSQTKLFTSSDGLNWNAGALLPNLHIGDVAFGNNTYVATGGIGVSGFAAKAVTATSTDLVNWTTLDQAAGLQGITFGGDQFVAVGDSGTILTSRDGKSWTARSTSSAHGLSSVTYGNNLFVAVGVQVIHTSTDGVTWTMRPYNIPLAFQLLSIAYGHGAFKIAASASAVQPYSTPILSSVDGITWSLDSAGTDIALRGITAGSVGFVSVGFDTDTSTNQAVLLSNP